jgi:hypothetical protein
MRRRGCTLKVSQEASLKNFQQAAADDKALGLEQASVKSHVAIEPMATGLVDVRSFINHVYSMLSRHRVRGASFSILGFLPDIRFSGSARSKSNIKGRWRERPLYTGP